MPGRRGRSPRERPGKAPACSSLVPSDFRGDFGGVERGSEPLLLAVVSRAIPKARPSDAGRTMAADDLAAGVLADDVVEEQVLGNDGIAFHAHHLGDVGDAARAVAQTG